ncbi:MAG: lysophospholipid acyltransferase family protein [Bacteroidota bacterium]
MSALIFYIFLPFIYLISILPFRLLYLISDWLYFLLFYCISYRKDVVMQNLRNSFPEKTEADLKIICKKFYHHLCDMTLETFKTLTIDKDTMLKRCTFDPESLALLEGLAAKDQNVILVMGHYGNWEWAGNTFSLLCTHRLYVIYHPLANKHFDKLLHDMRTRFGTKLIPMKETYRVMLDNNKMELSTTAFIADQAPSPNNAYWTTFLNQDTPVFKGTEIIATKINYPIVYSRVEKLKRGHYTLYVEMLCENPSSTKEGEISELHTRKLEKDIIAAPETWLWSHKRWKHKRPIN